MIMDEKRNLFIKDYIQINKLKSKNHYYELCVAKEALTEQKVT